MKIITAITLSLASMAAGATLALSPLASAASHANPGGPIHRTYTPHCAQVVIAQQTATGHEADLPVTECGQLPRPGARPYECDGQIQAHARLQCWRLP